jgi:hypothetical protein
VTVQMAIKVLDAEGQLTPAERLVLIQLAYRADRKGVVRISQTDLVPLTGLNRKTINGAYVLLMAVDILEREHQGRFRFQDGALDRLDELLAV